MSLINFYIGKFLKEPYGNIKLRQKCEKMITSFDKIADSYKNLVENNSKFINLSIEYLTEYKVKDLSFEIQKESIQYKKILNFGCGIGLSDPYLEKYFPNTHIVSCDISEKSLEIAKNNNKILKNTEYINLKENPFSFNNEFDVIFIANVIRHIPRINQLNIMNDLYKSLKKNGMIMIYEFNPYNPYTFYVYMKDDKNYDSDNVKIITPSYTRKLLKETGFKNLETKYRFYIPGQLKRFMFFENYLKKLPFGANYYITARK